MTAPHEETWTTGAGALSGALYSGDTWIGSFTNPERARLAHEAPQLARVLLAVLSCDGAAGPDGYGTAVVTIPAKVVDDAVATLKKAGALP